MGRLRYKIGLLKRILSFVIQENKWQDNNKYGLLESTAVFKKPCLIAEPSNVFIHKYSRLQTGARILNYTGKFIIKPYAVCSDNLLVVTGNHVPTVGIPQFFLGTSHINDRERDVVVEEGAWVGANVTLLSGVVVGRGAVVGAGSVVKATVPPYSVVSGNPAQIVASTFTIEQIIEHEKIVFAEDDRMTNKEIELLFSKYFVGMKAIGTSRIKDVDTNRYNELLSFLEKKPYKCNYPS